MRGQTLSATVVLFAGIALPAAAQQIVVAPAMSPPPMRTCITTMQRPDTAKLMTIGRNGIATTEMSGDDAATTTTDCIAR